MKKRLQKAINDYVILCILCLSLCSSCSLADRSAKPYQSVESISSALSDVTNTNDSILAKDRKIARIVATTVISENKKSFLTKSYGKVEKELILRNSTKSLDQMQSFVIIGKIIGMKLRVKEPL